MGKLSLIRDVLRKAVRIVSTRFPEYALTGKLAYNLYCRPETTRDIDFIAKLDDVRLAELIHYLETHGIIISPSETGHWMYMFYIKGVRVDLLNPPSLKYDDTMVSRRRVFHVPKVGNIYVLSPEDLALYYVVSAIERKRLGDEDRAFNIIYYSTLRRDFNKNYFLAKAQTVSDPVYALSIQLVLKVDKIIKEAHGEEKDSRSSLVIL